MVYFYIEALRGDKMKLLVAVIVYSVFLFHSAEADEILLKNGRTIEGKVISSDGSLLEVRTKIGLVSFRREDIESVKESELPEDFFRGVQDPADAPKIPDSDEEVIPGAPEQPGTFGDMPAADFGVTAYYSEEQKLINVEGRTTLPDGALVDVSVEGVGGFVLSGKCMVGAGRFDISFKTAGLNLTKGSYRAEAVFNPDNQTPDYRVKSSRTGLVKRGESLFRIGSEKESFECKEAVREELLPIVKELGDLYADMNDVIKVKLRAIDSAAQSVWSDRWRSRLKVLKRKIEKFRESRNAAGEYYPYTQQYISDTADCLSYLYNMYFREVKKQGTKTKNPISGGSSSGFENLNKDCGNKIVIMKKELSSQSGGNLNGEHSEK